LVFLVRLRHPPRGQVIPRSKWQPLYVLKSFTVCSRLQLVIQKCDGLLVMNQLLPTPIDLLSLLIVEFQSRLLQHAIGVGILEVLEIGSTRRSGGVPKVVWITNQIESETHHTCVKPMLFHHLAHQRKFDDTFCHLSTALSKLLGQHR